MIAVNEVFLDCRRLLSKDKAGYFSSDEFNRFSIMAEQMLFRFYMKRFEEHGAFADAMHPFNKSAVLGLDSASTFSLPSDFARRNILWYKKVENVKGGTGFTETSTKIQYLEKEEVQDTLDSPVRGPSIAKGKLYFSFVAGKAKVWPTIPGPVELDYLRNPTYAVRGFTVNGTTLEEDFDLATSTDYEWLENERSNIVDLILLQYGIVLRESDVVQYAKMQFTDNQNIKQL